MVAYWIRLTTSIFGNSTMAIRLSGIMGTVGILLFIRRLGVQGGLFIMIALSPLVLFGGVLITPDTPFLFFFAAYLIWVTSIHGLFIEWGGDPVTRVYRRSPVPLIQWAAGGLLLGLGALSKYTMLLAAGCTVLILVSKYRFQSWFRGLAVFALVAFLCILPVILFNRDHDWVSFRFQWNHAMIKEGFSWQYIGRYLGGQIALIGLLPFLMFPWVLLSKSHWNQDPILATCFYFYVPLFLFFFYQGSQTNFEANWSLMTYIGFWAMAQRLIQVSSFRYLNQFILGISFLPPLLASGLILWTLFSPKPILTAQQNRLARIETQDRVTRQVAHDSKQKYAGSPLFATTYQWTASLRYQGVHTEQLEGAGRPSQFTIKPVDPCQTSSILVVSPSTQPPSEHLQCFSRWTQLEEYPFVVQGQTLDTMVLRRYEK